MDAQAPTVDVIQTPSNASPWLKPYHFNGDTAREAARRRVQVAEERARRGIVIGARVKDWREGVTEIVAAQTGAAVSGKPGTSGAASFVLRAAGLLRDRNEPSAQLTAGASDDMALMLAAFRAWRLAHPEQAAELRVLAAGGERGGGGTDPDE